MNGIIAGAFPGGFGDEDLQLMNLADGRSMSSLEVRTADCIDLFRIDRAMLEVLEENMDDNFDLGDVDEDALEASGD